MHKVPILKEVYEDHRTSIILTGRRQNTVRTKTANSDGSFIKLII